MGRARQRQMPKAVLIPLATPNLASLSNRIETVGG